MYQLWVRIAVHQVGKGIYYTYTIQNVMEAIAQYVGGFDRGKDNPIMAHVIDKDYKVIRICTFYARYTKEEEILHNLHAQIPDGFVVFIHYADLKAGRLYALSATHFEMSDMAERILKDGYSFASYDPWCNLWHINGHLNSEALGK